MKRWRVIENKDNLSVAPWLDAVGIEEIDDDLETPGIVCWFCRGIDPSIPQHVVDAHNRSLNAGA
jgi:hypothetical protein